MQIELYSKLNEPLDAIDRMGKYFASSGMFGCSKEEQGKVLALVCITEGITPLQFMRRHHLMPDGRIVAKAHSVLADFRRIGGNHKWLKDGEDGKAARLWLKRADGETQEYEYTIDMAKREGLVRPGSRWEKNPGQVLRARCETNGVTMLCPEIMVDGDFDDAPTIIPLLPPEPAQVKSETPTPKRAKKEEKPIEAEVISEPPTGVNPTEGEPKPQGGSESIPPIGYQVTMRDGRVSPESVKALIAMCQARGVDFETKAVRWLDDKGYAVSGDLFSITQERLQKIFDNRDNWFQAVEAVQ